MLETNAQPAQPTVQRTRRWKRIVAAALLLIVGGAIVNVAVAWGCSLKHPPLRASAGMLAQELHEDFFGYPTWRMPIDSDGIGYRQRHLQLHREDMYSNQTWHAAVAVEAGWPVLALRGVHRGSYISRDSPQSYGDGAIVVDSEDGRPHILPLRPKWFGFLFNTYLYAAHLWLLFFAPFTARRALRRRRRVCEKCAYPVGTSPICTECGAQVLPTASKDKAAI